MNKFILPLALFGSLGVTPAAALTVIQTETVPAGAAGPPNNPTNFSFNQFDTSLGTLDDVTLTISAAMTAAAGTLANSGNPSKTFTLTEGANAKVTGTGFALTDTIGSGSEDLTVPGKSSVSIGPFSGSGDNSATLNTGLAVFEGVGTLPYAFTGTSLFKASNGGKVTLSPMVSGTVTLTYDYSLPGVVVVPSAPEPMTWSLLILGMFGVGGALRSRRSRGLVAAAA
ncbi:MAG TPA: choice-of-anchor E domain-containing protein [Caulobacteraceae bacterium]|jgi:hypothetical protein|nr:choice-of-anchor E domain-containing protein [Caulobacteraceae bacterium]